MSTADSSLTPLADHAGFLFAQLGYESAFRFTEALSPLGIGPRHHGTLRVLQLHDGQTQQQLCDALHIHRNVMVGLVDELEQRQLVQRRRHPEDRRAYAVHLLPAAHELLAQTAPLVQELDDEMLAPLSPDERRTLLSLLKKVSTGAGLVPGVHPGITRGSGSGSRSRAQPRSEVPSA